eukprot:gene39620-53566_t
MKIQFYGAAQRVTGSKHLITTNKGTKILLDCGLFQGIGTTELNLQFGFDPKEASKVLFTHAAGTKFLRLFLQSAALGLGAWLAVERQISAGAIIAASILGAAVGLFVQPRLFAIAMALSLSGAAHLVLGFLAQLAAKSPNRQALAEQLALVTTTDVHGIWPVMAAGGAGSILAAILWSLTERQSTDVFWFLPNEGDRRNGVRSMALVENRDGVHDEKNLSTVKIPLAHDSLSLISKQCLVRFAASVLDEPEQTARFTRWLAQTARFTRWLAPSGDSGVQRIGVSSLQVSGITCAACMPEIERGLASVPGVARARLNLTTHRLAVDWDPDACDADAVVRRLEVLGYRAHPFDPARRSAEEEAEARELWRCMGVAGFAAMNVMLLSVSVWAGNVTDIEPETRDLFHWISAIITIPA